MKLDIRTVTLCLAVTTATVGCDSKVKECNQLIEVVNRAVAKVDGLGPGLNTDDPAQMQKEMKEFIDIAKGESKAISDLNIKNEGLKPHADAYKKMLDDAISAANELVQVLGEAEDLSDANIEKALKDHDKARDDLQAACEAASDDCTKVGNAMSKLPDEMNPDDAAKVLGELGDELEKLELTDEKVKGATTEYVAAIREYTKLLAEDQKFDAQVVEVAGKIDTAVSEEDSIVSALNAYCQAG